MDCGLRRHWHEKVMAGMWRSNVLSVHLYLGSGVQAHVTQTVSTLCRPLPLLHTGHPTLPIRTYAGPCQPHWRTWTSVLFDWLALYAKELTYSIVHSALLSSGHLSHSPSSLLPHSFLLCCVRPWTCLYPRKVYSIIRLLYIGSIRL